MNAFYCENKKKEIRTFYIEEIKEINGIIQTDSKFLILKSLDSIDPSPIPDELKDILGDEDICTGRLPISIEISEREFIKKFGEDKYRELIENKIIDLEVDEK